MPIQKYEVSLSAEERKQLTKIVKSGNMSPHIRDTVAFHLTRLIEKITKPLLKNSLWVNVSSQLCLRSC